MRVTPVRFTADVPGMRRFLVALGLDPELASDAGTWQSLAGTGGGVGLHAAEAAETPQPSGTTGLAFETDEPLERIGERLSAAGFDSAIVDEAFGRSLRTVDADGVDVHVYAVMTDLHGYRAE